MSKLLAPKVFFLYPLSHERKRYNEPNNYFSGRRYALYGKDKATDYGVEPMDDFEVCENIEMSKLGVIINRLINKIVVLMGGYGGDWYKAFKLRSKFEKCDIVFSTTDRVGIPLILLMAIRLIPKKPIVYASVGLPERIRRMNGFFSRIFKQAIRRYVKLIIAYGKKETEELSNYLLPNKEIVRFIPFGVDIDFFSPGRYKNQNTLICSDEYVLSIGADPYRDFELLLRISPLVDERIVIITLPGMFSKNTSIPRNVAILYKLNFDQIPFYINRAKFIVLPVKENSYSGATTTLLQCMAMGKAVIVTKTSAISDGYDLEHLKNVVFTEPGDAAKLLECINLLEKNRELRKYLGEEAIKTVVAKHSWNRYCKQLFSAIKEVQSL